MSKRVAFVIDGEFMRKRIISSRAFYYNGSGIRSYCYAHLVHMGESNSKFAVYYYDSRPYMGKGEHPVSGPIDFSITPLTVKKNSFFDTLRSTPNFHIRFGRSAWQANQWQLDNVRLGELMAGEISPNDITDNDIYPDIRQKGVDIRIGLDVAKLVYKNMVDTIVLIGNDLDLTPACKIAREEGVEVILDPLYTKAPDELRENVDYVRSLIHIDNSLKYEDNKDINPDNEWIEKSNN